MKKPENIPFILSVQRYENKSVLLLPSPNVTLTFIQNENSIEGIVTLPHKSIFAMDKVLCCLTLAPNFIKSLLGKPTDYTEQQMTCSSSRFLEDFTFDESLQQVSYLLNDLRSSLEITNDEAQFNRIWQTYNEPDELLPTSDRQVQRLCKRYAGQTPETINLIKKLARTLDADNSTGHYNSLGDFADASHLARVCKQFTGYNPSHWKNSSQLFYYVILRS